MTGRQRDPTPARAARARTRDTLRATQAAQARFARKYRLRCPTPLAACAIEWLHTGRRWTRPARVTFPLLEYPLGDHLRGWRAEETGRRPYAVVTECYLAPADALAEAQRIAAACGLRAELLPLADTVHWAACPEVAAGCAVVAFTRAADRPLSERRAWRGRTAAWPQPGAITGRLTYTPRAHLRVWAQRIRPSRVTVSGGIRDDHEEKAGPRSAT